VNGTDWMSHFSLVAPTTLITSYVIAGLFAIIMILKPRRRRGHWYRHIVIASVLGAIIGGTAIWVVGDVMNAFDVPPTWVDRIWTGVMVGGICVGVVNIVFGPAGRKILAVLAIASFVVAGGLAINRDVGEYLTLSQALGTDKTAPLTIPKPSTTGDVAFSGDLYTKWKAPKVMPSHGRVGSVTIPGLKSGFAARDALVYLPPAALVASAPALPVVILMSGQPASPSSVMTAGKVPETMNALAKRNHGLAPIVVVPDQLGADANNPMCVNGPLGNSATYITQDVPNWIKKHLHVQTQRQAWAVGGFSQGATCSIQFGTGDPATFGAFISVSGQQYPTLSSDAAAITQGFGGSKEKFDAAKPANVMAKHGKYDDTVGYFVAGQTDPTYRHNMAVMSDLAQKHGIKVTRFISPGSGHDWVTAANGFAHGIADLYPRFGLAKSVPLQ
jgi:enterochelin esterase-like enzyme